MALSGSTVSGYTATASITAIAHGVAAAGTEKIPGAASFSRVTTGISSICTAPSRVAAASKAAIIRTAKNVLSAASIIAPAAPTAAPYGAFLFPSLARGTGVEGTASTPSRRGRDLEEGTVSPSSISNSCTSTASGTPFSFLSTLFTSDAFCPTFFATRRCNIFPLTGYLGKISRIRTSSGATIFQYYASYHPKRCCHKSGFRGRYRRR